MPESGHTVTGGSNVFGKLTDPITFLDRNERTRQSCGQKGYLYGLCCLYLEMPDLTDTSELIDELSEYLVNDNGYVDCMAWLDCCTSVMTFQLSNESRVVSRAIELHLCLEKFAENHPALRHYLGVTVNLGEKDSIYEMINRATSSLTEGFRTLSDQQSGTVRFDKRHYHTNLQVPSKALV